MNDILYAGKHLLTWDVPRHAHDSWELIYCTGGSGRFVFDDGLELAYQPGDVVLIPPHVPHYNASDEGFTNLHLNLADCTLNLSGPMLVQDDSNRFILQACTAAYVHFCGELSRRAALLSAYGELIVAYLSAYQDAPPHSQVVQEIESSIIQNYPDCNYELDAYLHSLPFSYDYLRKLFKKELGVTPHQYLIDKRLQTAADKLCNMQIDGYSVSDISRLCGFREPLYFSRIFKKRYGVAPSYYLERRGTAAVPLDADSVKLFPAEL